MDTDVPTTLLPCAICARTFMPQSLEKHTKICEQSVNKKRKPFDSAKQRIQGTELAEFVPKRERKRHSPDDKYSSQPKSSWKQTHDELLRAVRAARNEAEVSSPMPKQAMTSNTSNPPTRANEQGVCPTCNRHFGLKAYDRHVAWCKDRIVRVSATPATNVAKERLEARMKYRAPSMKNRRPTTHEKYSPGSAAVLGSGNKTSPTMVTSRAKESASAPNCKTSDSPVKQKIAVVRRPGHQRESSCPTVPMKSRPADRGYRPPEDEGGPVTFRPPAPSVKRMSHLPVPPLKHKRGSLEECNSIPSPTLTKRPPKRASGNVKRDETFRQKGKQDERPQVLHSARSQTTNIVSARSMGHPKVNDVSINEDIMGFTVKPCNIHKENKYTTWKQISQEKDRDCLETSCKNENSARNVKPQCLPNTSNRYLKLNTASHEDLSVYKQQMESIDVALDKNIFEESATDLSLYEQQLKDVDAMLDEEGSKEETSELSLESETINWPLTSPSLSRTYSFKDMSPDEAEIFKCKKWKPVRHSPRVEFCFGDPEKMNHIPPMYFNYAEEQNSRDNVTTVEEATVRMESSKNFPIENDGMPNHLQLEERNLIFETSSSQTKLVPEQFESLENGIVTNCDQASPKNNFEEDAPSHYSNTETVDVAENLDENVATASVSNNDLYNLQEDNLLNCASSEINVIKDDKANVSTERLQLSTSFEQFANLDIKDDFCETSEPEWNSNVMCTDVRESIESLSDNNRLETEAKEALHDQDMETENHEIDSDSRTYTQSVENDIECPVDNESVEDETQWMKIKSNESLTKNILQPTRSSTPFVNEDVSLNSNCNGYEDFQQELDPPFLNKQWEVEVDRERGSEMMYLIEYTDSNCPNPKILSGDQIDKLERSDSNNDTTLTQMPLSDKHITADTCLDCMPAYMRSNASKIASNAEEQNGKFSRFESPTMERQEVTDPSVLTKEIASQVNICKCPLKQFPSRTICENNVVDDCIDLDQTICYSEEQACDDVISNENIEDNETVEKPTETQAAQDVEENNYNSNADESSTHELVTDLEESKQNDEQNHLNIRDHDNEDNLPEISTHSVIKVQPVSKDFKEIYKNRLNQEFDTDSDNSMEHHIKDAIDELKSYTNKRENAKQDVQNLRSYVMSESCVKMSQRVQVNDPLNDQSTALRSRRSKRLQMEHRIHENTKYLNESSDSLESSMDPPNVKLMESVEVETIEEIGTRNRSIRFRILPEIRGTTVVVKENYNESKKIDTYWEKASKASRNRLINLDPPYQGASRFLKRNPKVRVLPPVPSSSSLIKHRNIKLPLRPVWSNYVRRRPDFNLVLSGRTGKNYDPFLLAEQQMNDLLSDTSEQSMTDNPSIGQNRDSNFPLSHSSAFAKYPSQSNSIKRSSLIAPPTEFDDLTSDFSSDTTETNSLSCEIFLKDIKDNEEPGVEKKSPVRELGRRVIIDKSKALGKGVDDDVTRGSRSFVSSSDRARKILDKVSPKVVRPTVNRSLSVRAASAPKTMTDRKTSNNSYKSTNNNDDTNSNPNSRINNNYATLSASNLSLSSTVSSNADIKRSNSVFDGLMTSFEDENGSFASLKSLLKNDPLSMSSPAHGRRRNGQISDEELSSPESYKRQDHSKMSADSAYSSLNRKYSHHGRSTNDVEGRFEVDPPRSIRREGSSVTSISKCKLSKYCHECGSKFPETAKFCCECGIRRLAL